MTAIKIIEPIEKLSATERRKLLAFISRSRTKAQDAANVCSWKRWKKAGSVSVPLAQVKRKLGLA